MKKSPVDRGRQPVAKVVSEGGIRLNDATGMIKDQKICLPF